MKDPKKSFNKRKMLELFTTFFKLGLFTFGGGYAMIPLIEREVVDKKKWIDRKDILDVFALSESVPGSISVNTSTIIGYKIAGNIGAITALFGVVLPSFLVISAIAIFASQFRSNPLVDAAFLGIRCAVVGLITKSAARITKASIVDIMGIVLMLVTVVLTVFVGIHAIFSILLGSVCGIAMPMLNVCKGGHQNDIS